MQVDLKASYFGIVFVLIFATIALWKTFPESPFFATTMGLYAAAYILHEPAHAITAKLIGLNNIILSLGGGCENYVDFEIEDNDPEDLKKVSIVYGAGAAVQVIQCTSIIFAAIITEWNNVTFLPTIIAIIVFLLFLLDFKIPKSDISQAMRAIQEV